MNLMCVASITHASKRRAPNPAAFVTSWAEAGVPTTTEPCNALWGTLAACRHIITSVGGHVGKHMARLQCSAQRRIVYIDISSGTTAAAVRGQRPDDRKEARVEVT